MKNSILKITFTLLLVSFMGFFVSSLYAEEEPIEFKNSEPYIDYEFEELQKTFLKNRKIQLATLKKLPLNQYPEEFLIELTNQVKREIKQEMQKELLDYLKKMMNKRSVVAQTKKTTVVKTPPKRTAPIIKTTPLVQTQKKEKTKPTTQKQVVQRQKTEAPKPAAKISNRIAVFSLNSNATFLGINSLTKLNIRVGVESAPQVAYADVSIFLKNIGTDMIYMLKRFTLNPIKNSRTFDFLWEYPSIPFGKYKPYVTVKFYDKNQRQIDELTQFWGNSSSKNMYILFKN